MHFKHTFEKLTFSQILPPPPLKLTNVNFFSIEGFPDPFGKKAPTLKKMFDQHPVKNHDKINIS